MIFTPLLSPSRWRNARAKYMAEARACRATLTDPQGLWRYSPDDARVAKAVEFWLHRARNAHAFAMGRKPIGNFVIVNRGEFYQGPLYATEEVQNEHQH